MTRVSTSLFPLLFFARISGLIVAALVISWALLFKSSFLPQSSSHEDLIYAVLHPLLMVIGFILLSGEAILVHRWLPGSGNLKKSVHLCLQGVALASGIFGIWTKFQGKDGIVANFFSLHSWMGLICISLFGAQVLFFISGLLCSFYLFFFTAILTLLFLLNFSYLPCANSEARYTFLQTNRNVSKRSTESMVVNSLGLGLALLSGMVIFAAVSPKRQSLHSKIMYSESDTKCLSS
eukprot:XP_025014074.1 probable transmembrane ascorbate ferrireductase 4 [Ricinus communis]